MAKQLKEIEIPFGTKDSEFCGWKYTIPEGMEATIVDNEIVVKKKKSKDESIREALIEGLRAMKVSFHTISSIKIDDAIAWLEKQVQKPQGKSALEAAREEKVDNANKVEPKDHSSIDPHFWKPIDKIEPKFHEGDYVVQDRNILKIRYVGDEYYCFETIGGHINTILVSEIDSLYHKFTIQDAKPGNVLVHNGCTFIFMGIKDGIVQGIEENMLEPVSLGEPDKDNDYYPASKEQCDTLVKAMADAGYTFDFEKKELKKIEQKNAWSEEDERMYKELYHLIYSAPYGDSRKKLSDWFKSIKDVVQTQPKQEWKQENIGDLDGFEIVMMQIGSSFFGKNAGLDPNDTNAIKEQANILLGLVQKQEWSKEDEKIIKRIDSLLYSQCKIHGSEYEEIHNWLKSLRPQNKWKPSDEQMELLKELVEDNNQRHFYTILKSLYDQLKILKGK